MKTGIHPEYKVAKVTCGCGNSFVTRSTKSEIHVEICSKCHPFYTGKQKLVDSTGQVEKFLRRYGLKSSADSRSEDETEAGEAEAERAPADDQ